MRTAAKPQLQPEGLAVVLRELHHPVHVAHVHEGHVIWTTGGQPLLFVDVGVNAHLVHILQITHEREHQTHVHEGHVIWTTGRQAVVLLILAWMLILYMS